MLDALTRLPLRWAATAVHRLRALGWRVRRPRTFGAHAVALTPGGRIVLVRLRYAPGWRLPGGGRSEEEDPRAAVLRELREEIGMVSHGSVEPLGAHEERPDHGSDLAELFLVRDVVYRPSWSLEVEQVIEADPDALPADLAEPARRWLAMARAHLQGEGTLRRSGPLREIPD